MSASTPCPPPTRPRRRLSPGPEKDAPAGGWKSNGVYDERKRIGKSFVFFVAQTTGVTLMPLLEMMRKRGLGCRSPSPLPSRSLKPSSCLQESEATSQSASSFRPDQPSSTMQHMVQPSQTATKPPQVLHGRRRTHKGHFLNIFCSSYYTIHQKLKRQSKKALGKHKSPGAGFTLPMQEGGDENLARFYLFLPYSYRATSTHAGGKLRCPVCLLARLCVTRQAYIQH